MSELKVSEEQEEAQDSEEGARIERLEAPGCFCPVVRCFSVIFCYAAPSKKKTICARPATINKDVYKKCTCIKLYPY